jgi:hypothetical protein
MEHIFNIIFPRFSPNVIRVVKQRTKIWAGLVSRKEKGNMWGVLVGSRNERVESENFGVKRRATIKWILNPLNGRA